MNALLIGVVLFCLTPVAQFLPLNALAAIVITGVVPVMDFRQLLHLAKVGKRKLLNLSMCMQVADPMQLVQKLFSGEVCA